MKFLFFLPLTFLLFLSSEVSSQNPNMFNFNIICNDDRARACNAMPLYVHAGQIISDNLVLTRMIDVNIIVLYEEQDLIAFTYPNMAQCGTDGSVSLACPTALLKQLDPNFHSEGTPDIFLSVNSRYDPYMWFGDGSIQSYEFDIVETILHELFHGLGMVSYWSIANAFGLFPLFGFETDETGKMTFYGFSEFIFDKYLISLENGDLITTYAQSLNDMAGPGRTYNNVDEFYNSLDNDQQQQGKSYSIDTLYLATTPKKLGFLPNTAKSSSDVILLDTHDDPFNVGSNIGHVDRDYTQSSDFLLVPYSVPGQTLQQKIEAYGNAPGGGIGPRLRLILETLGYQLRINPTEFKKRKPKRIENYL